MGVPSILYHVGAPLGWEARLRWENCCRGCAPARRFWRLATRHAASSVATRPSVHARALHLPTRTGVCQCLAARFARDASPPSRGAVDEDSPLYGLSQADMEELDAEILVILDGIDETTATPVQVLCMRLAGDADVACAWALAPHWWWTVGVPEALCRPGPSWLAGCRRRWQQCTHTASGPAHSMARAGRPSPALPMPRTHPRPGTRTSPATSGGATSSGPCSAGV